MNVLYVKITTHGLPEPHKISYSRTPLAAEMSTEEMILVLNDQAERQGVDATYELATEEEYWTHRTGRASCDTGTDLRSKT